MATGGAREVDHRQDGGVGGGFAGQRQIGQPCLVDLEPGEERPRESADAPDPGRVRELHHYGGGEVGADGGEAHRVIKALGHDGADLGDELAHPGEAGSRGGRILRAPALDIDAQHLVRCGAVKLVEEVSLDDVLRREWANQADGPEYIL